MNSAMTVQERKWREEDDARTLAEAETIKADKARLQGAQSAAKRLVNEQADRTRSLQKVAGKRVQPERPRSNIQVAGYELPRIKG